MLRRTFKMLSVSELFGWFDERCLAVPEIQREFVWNAQRACKLLDSIRKGYPVGTALIWCTGKEDQSLLRHTLHMLPPFDPAHNREIRYLIDGQQRLSVLHLVREGKTIRNSTGREIRFGDIHFSLDDEEDAFVSLRRPDPRVHFQVSEILSDHWYRHFGRLPAYKRKKIKACRQSLLGYRLPVLLFHTRELADVRETFIRVNAQGMRISEADRAFTSASRVKPLHRYRQLCERLPHGYSMMDKSVYWTSLVLVKGYQDVGQKAFVRLTLWIDRTGEGEQWFNRHEPKVAEAISLACDHLVNQLKVSDFKLLPYENMIAVLATFFYWNRLAQPSPAQRDQIRRWFWHTGVLKRYAGAGFRKHLLGDTEFFKRLGRTRRGQYRIDERTRADALLNEDYRASSALSRAFRLMLLRQKPRYITNGEEVPLGPVASRRNKRDLHHVWPRDLLRRHGIGAGRYNVLCNICCLVAHDNRSFGCKLPAVYLDDFRRQPHFPRAMKGHMIPHTPDSPLWDENVRRGFKAFVEQRNRLLQKAFKELAGTRLFES